MKVFGWTSFWNDPRITDNHKQVRCICASKSMAAIKRTYGFRQSNLWNIRETGNDREIALASNSPLSIFARDLNNWNAEYFLMHTPKDPTKRQEQC
jgi:hypothetical protein